MQYAQNLSTMRPAVMPAHAPGLMTFMPTARARLDWRADVFGDSRDRQTGQDPSERRPPRRYMGLNTSAATMTSGSGPLFSAQWVTSLPSGHASPACHSLAYPPSRYSVRLPLMM